MQTTISKITASLAILGLLSGAALSHGGATGIVKERMDVMSGIGKNMKAIGAMMKGEAEFDGAMISKKAAEISEHAKTFPAFFKEQFEDKHTEASPAIWQKPEEFQKYSDELVTYSMQLSAEAAESKDPKMIQASFQQVAGTCKSCHEAFRIKKEH